MRNCTLCVTLKDISVEYPGNVCFPLSRQHPVYQFVIAKLMLTGVTFRVTFLFMIKTFKHKGLENYFYTGSKKGIRPEHANRLARILDRLNAATELKDMNYPGSCLHLLSGDKKGLHAVKVSGNWRIFFRFIDGDAYIVDYDDYH